MSMHVFGKNDFGTACVRCGYFNHTEEAGQPCSGRYDEKLISDAQVQIDKLQLKIDLVKRAGEMEATQTE